MNTFPTTGQNATHHLPTPPTAQNVRPQGYEADRLNEMHLAGINPIAADR